MLRDLDDDEFLSPFFGCFEVHIGLIIGDVKSFDRSMDDPSQSKDGKNQTTHVEEAVADVRDRRRVLSVRVYQSRLLGLFYIF